jgi:hypothetical protein
MAEKVPEGMVIVDIWGPPHSTDHVARYVVALDEALPLAIGELKNGFLVNLRLEPGWRSFDNFDTRLEQNKGEPS